MCALGTPGFVDPFDVVRDVTLDHPKYRVCGVSLMKGKLDWYVLLGETGHTTGTGCWCTTCIH